jgi:hypothetical protein
MLKLDSALPYDVASIVSEKPPLLLALLVENSDEVVVSHSCDAAKHTDSASYFLPFLLGPRAGSMPAVRIREPA